MNNLLEGISTALNHPSSLSVALIVSLVLIVIGLVTGWIQKLISWVWNKVFSKSKDDSKAYISAGGNINAGRDIVVGNKQGNTKNITIKKTIISNSTLPDIEFIMKSNYRSDRAKGSVFAKLQIPYPSSVVEAIFVDMKEVQIGRFTKFEKILKADNELVANYFIDNEDDRERFLSTVYKQNGRINMIVALSSGKQYLYTFKSQTDCWKMAFEQNHPNMQDTFILVGKQPYVSLSEEEKDILLSAYDSGSSSIYKIKTDQEVWVRAGKTDYAFQKNSYKTRKYVEALDELEKQEFVEFQSGSLYELSTKGTKKAKVLSIN